MRKQLKYLLVLSLFLTFYSCGIGCEEGSTHINCVDISQCIGSDEERALIVYAKQGRECFYKGEKYTGCIIEYSHILGVPSLSKKRNYKNGLLDGLDIQYYNRYRWYVRNWKEGKLHGEWCEYDTDDGYLYKKGYYEQGKQNGVWFEYFKSGRIAKEQRYLNGRIIDRGTTYYPNGQKKRAYKDSICTDYYRNGTVKEKNIIHY